LVIQGKGKVPFGPGPFGKPLRTDGVTRGRADLVPPIGQEYLDARKGGTLTVPQPFYLEGTTGLPLGDIFWPRAHFKLGLWPILGTLKAQGGLRAGNKSCPWAKGSQGRFSQGPGTVAGAHSLWAHPGVFPNLLENRPREGPI